MSDENRDLIKQVKAGELPRLAKLLTTLERQGPACLGSFPELLQPAQLGFRIGITGPPGAGKSTLIGQLIRHFRTQNQRVGVIAVDPSSPFSKGAVLGDRIRYSEHFTDPGVFIRSLGSRGSLGGLSASAYLMVRAFDLAGFDIVLLETVGVGQTELEIMNVADHVAVTLVPESGDSIQGMKAGLLEIANTFIVNKGDRPGSDIFIRELESALHLDSRMHANPTRIFKTTATNGDGLSELCQYFLGLSENPMWKSERLNPERLRAEARALLREAAELEIAERTSSLGKAEDFMNLFRTDPRKIKNS